MRNYLEHATNALDTDAKISSSKKLAGTADTFNKEMSQAGGGEHDLGKEMCKHFDRQDGFTKLMQLLDRMVATVADGSEGDESDIAMTGRFLESLRNLVKHVLHNVERLKKDKGNHNPSLNSSHDPQYSLIQYQCIDSSVLARCSLRIVFQVIQSGAVQ